jgi:hypothetical protein
MYMSVENKEKSQAMIAWSLSRQAESADYQRASDEELALLAEAKLDSTRRAQILHVIAHDDGEYLRWMNVQHTLASANAFAVQRAEKGSSFIAILKNLMFSWQAGGTGFALASTIAVAIFLIRPGENFDYNSHAQNWRHSGTIELTLPQDGVLRGPAASADTRSLSREEQVILAGVLEGLQLMGTQFKIENLSNELPLSPMEWVGDHKAYEQWAMVGKFSVLSYFKCRTDSDAAYFEKARPALKHLQSLLQKQDGTLAARLSQPSHSALSDRDAVCRFSDKVMSRLARETR